VARVFITGSSDGLGLMAARLLIDQRHDVVLHGRNEGRSRDALAAAAGAGGVVSGDLSTIAGPRTVADEVNKLGRFDAVIHNAGVGYCEGRVEMDPGVPSVFAVNVRKRPSIVLRPPICGRIGVPPAVHCCKTTLLLWTRASDRGLPVGIGRIRRERTSESMASRE
jgi:NAD(P)-dependent dehydrogenase (short-subunit alcohol dehydrogenase family)